MNFLIHWSSSSTRVLPRVLLNEKEVKRTFIGESRSCNNLDRLPACLQRTFGFIAHIEGNQELWSKNRWQDIFWFGNVSFPEKIIHMTLKPGSSSSSPPSDNELFHPLFWMTVPVSHLWLRNSNFNPFVTKPSSSLSPNGKIPTLNFVTNMQLFFSSSMFTVKWLIRMVKWISCVIILHLVWPEKCHNRTFGMTTKTPSKWFHKSIHAGT